MIKSIPTHAAVRLPGRNNRITINHRNRLHPMDFQKQIIQKDIIPGFVALMSIPEWMPAAVKKTPLSGLFSRMGKLINLTCSLVLSS